MKAEKYVQSFLQTNKYKGCPLTLRYKSDRVKACTTSVVGDTQSSSSCLSFFLFISFLLEVKGTRSS